MDPQLLKRTEVTIEAAVNTPGILYYNMYVNGTVANRTLLELKTLVKNHNLTLSQEQTQVDIIQGRIFDDRVDLVVIEGDKQLILIDKLQPQTSYHFCAYFETQFNHHTEKL